MLAAALPWLLAQPRRSCFAVTQLLFGASHTDVASLPPAPCSCSGCCLQPLQQPLRLPLLLSTGAPCCPLVPPAACLTAWTDQCSPSPYPHAAPSRALAGRPGVRVGAGAAAVSDSSGSSCWREAGAAARAAAAQRRWRGLRVGWLRAACEIKSWHSCCEGAGCCSCQPPAAALGCSVCGPHLDQLCDRADAPPRQLRQQDHALDAVVLQQRHVGAHLSDGLDLRGPGRRRTVGRQQRAAMQRQPPTALRALRRAAGCPSRRPAATRRLATVSSILRRDPTAPRGPRSAGGHRSAPTARTWTMTTSSTSGYFGSYMRESACWLLMAAAGGPARPICAALPAVGGGGPRSKLATAVLVAGRGRVGLRLGQAGEARPGGQAAGSQRGESWQRQIGGLLPRHTKAQGWSPIQAAS